jgi:hypothetical protein
VEHKEESENRIVLHRAFMIMAWGVCAGPAAIFTLWCLRVPLGAPLALLVALLSVAVGRRSIPPDRALFPIYARFTLILHNAMVAVGCVYLMLRMLRC